MTRDEHPSEDTNTNCFQVNRTDINHDTALIMACRLGNADIVRMLLAREDTRADMRNKFVSGLTAYKLFN